VGLGACATLGRRRINTLPSILWRRLDRVSEETPIWPSRHRYGRQHSWISRRRTGGEHPASRRQQL